MKRLLTMSALLLSGIATHAQIPYAYIPFPTSNAEWTVFYKGTCMNDDPPPVVYKYALYGDTTLNGKTYKKLGTTVVNFSTGIPVIVGGLREENKKVYYITITPDHPLGRMGLTEEVLLYDFDAQVGEVIVHDASNPVANTYNPTVLAIDTVLFNGTYRKRYNMGAAQYAAGTEYWIEGVGSITDGLISKITPMPTCGHWYWENVCFRENSNTIYRNSDYQDCDGNKPLSDIPTSPSGAAVKIFPNPAISEIHINNIAAADGIQAKLIDYTGRILLAKDLKQADNVMALPPHASFCILLLNDRQGRIIRQQKIAVR